MKHSPTLKTLIPVLAPLMAIAMMNVSVQMLLLLQPPVEKPEAITDEDSDVDDTEDANHLPRRILVAEASFAKRRLIRNHSTTDQAEAESPRLKVLFIYYY